jgi:O-antigen ligase
MIVQYFTGASLSFAGIQSRSVLDMSESVGGVRVAGTIGSPNAAGSYLAPTLAIVFGAYLTKGKLINRTLAIAAFGLGLVALILTAVRSAWISFAVAILITIFQAARTKTGQRAVLVVLVFVAIVGLSFSERIIFRLTKDDHSSAESREWLAETAFNIIKAHPLGVGVNNYDQVMSYKYAARELIGHTLRVVHNKYLLIWAEMGPWGLLAFIWLLAAAVGRGVKWVVKYKEASHLSILVASLVGGLVGYAANMNSEAFGGRIRDQFLWFMIALVVVTSQLVVKSLPKQASGIQLSGGTTQ